MKYDGCAPKTQRAYCRHLAGESHEGRWPRERPNSHLISTTHGTGYSVQFLPTSEETDDDIKMNIQHVKIRLFSRAQCCQPFRNAYLKCAIKIRDQKKKGSGTLNNEYEL